MFRNKLRNVFFVSVTNVACARKGETFRATCVCSNVSSLAETLSDQDGECQQREYHETKRDLLFGINISLLLQNNNVKCPSPKFYRKREITTVNFPFSV